MRVLKNIVMVASLAGIVAVPVAPALAGQSVAEAEKLRKLDIMLMVSSLRCRTGKDDFRPEYSRFTSNHITQLNQASQTLKAQWTAKLGAKGAARQLDKMSVTMANKYGQGHPWMDCAELKSLAGDLAKSKEPAKLVAAADTYLGDRPVRLASSDQRGK